MAKNLTEILSACFVAVGIALVGGCENGGVGEEDEVSFSDWDTDRDGYLSENEFQAGFDRWDTNRDGMVSEEEFGF